jgi:SPX domain protein involved in polyphosphate accumulation
MMYKRDTRSNAGIDNVDYDALKHLIKTNTTRDAGQAVAIPGQVDTGLQRFEGQFFNELSNQHDRVGLFVRSKAEEIHRRLGKDSRSEDNKTIG